MYVLEKEVRFEASHQLPHHDGKCARLHGHSWRATLVVVAEELQSEGPKQGMAVDYGDIKAAIKPLLDEKLDHYHLNDSTGLENPTSEALARWIYDQVKASLPGLRAVRVEETCTSRATYVAGDDDQSQAFFFI